MSGQIFISYRRDDAPHPAGRLRDLLSVRFPQTQIFMDVDMAPGLDFVEEIEKNVGSCKVLVAVIGRRWLTATDEEGKRRLDQPEDFVRLEIAAALKRGIPVSPVLVDGASMPQAGDLPDDLKPLVRRQALRVSYERFHADAQPLIGVVEQAMEQQRAIAGKRVEEGVAKFERAYWTVLYWITVGILILFWVVGLVSGEVGPGIHWVLLIGLILVVARWSQRVRSRL